VIVLDENLHQRLVRKPLAARSKGKVLSVRDLRRGTIIKDEAIPALLCQHRGAMFVTTNVSDFWRRVPAHSLYCVLCLPLPNERQSEIPYLVLKLMRHPAFRTTQQRMGKVIRITDAEITYYESPGFSLRKVAWE
jgi:hypothetical protein